MRKFLNPIINLVNVILVTIAFILGNSLAIEADNMNQTYYELVWTNADKANIIGIVGFFVLIAAALLMLVNFLPMKARKFIAPLTGLMFIAAGVLFLKTPGAADQTFTNPELTGALIAMAVLVFIAGAFSLLMTVIDFTAKKAE